MDTTPHLRRAMRERVSAFLCALAAAGVVGLAGLPASAAEPPRTSSLGWVRLPGAEACVGARDVALAVEQRLGRTVFVSPAHAEVFIEGRVEPSAAGKGFQVHLTLADDRGTVLGARDLETHAKSCRALDEQLALVIALLIDPEGAQAPPAPPRAPVTPPLPVVAPRVEGPVVVVAAAPPARERWRESLEVGTAIGVGLLPGAAVGLTFRAELTPPSFFAIELGGTFWLDGRADAGGKGSVLSLSYGRLGLCPLALIRARTRLVGCSAIEVGSMRAAGYGFHPSRGEERPIVQAALEGRLEQRIVGALQIGLGLGLTVPFDRARFFYLDASGAEQDLYRMSPIAGVVSGTIGVAFP